MRERETKPLGGGYMRGICLIMGLWLVLFCGWALAQDEKPYEVSLSAGASVNNYGDKANRAAEFKSQVDKDSTWYFSGKGRVEEGDLLLPALRIPPNGCILSRPSGSRSPDYGLQSLPYE